MSRQVSQTSTSQHESRISTLEKSQAHRKADAENGANIPRAIHLEGPHDVLRALEEAASLVLNAKGGLDLAKGRALTYIAVKAANLLPLVEAATAQEKDWDKIRREQEVMFDKFSRDPEAKQVVLDYMELTFKIQDEAERRYQAKLMREREFSRASEEKEGRDGHNHFSK